MKKHWLYLKYIVKHKYFVWVAGRILGVSIWRLLIHDWSKFLPCEWGPYVDWFYGKADYKTWDDVPPALKSGELGYFPTVRSTQEHLFDMAWNHHQKANKHHWQYWVLGKDDGGVKVLHMMPGYAKEMLADWLGAGRGITGKWDVWDWYKKNKEKIQLHPETQVYVEDLMEFDAKKLLTER